MENKIYVVYDYWESYKPMYAFESEADAQEFLLSIVEEEEYRRFSINPDDYFETIKFHREFNMADKVMSLAGVSLWDAGFNYEIQEVKYIKEC